MASRSRLWVLLLLTVPGIAQEAVDDSALRGRCERQISALCDGNSTAKLPALRAELGNGRYPLELLAADATPRSGEELYRRAQGATLIVSKRYNCGRCGQWHFSHASGYLIHASGVFVTSYHVLRGTEEGWLCATGGDGITHGVEKVLAASEADDLVVMKILGDEQFPCLPLGATPPVGRHIYSLSHPDHRFYHFADGIVARYFVEGGRTRMAVTADHAKGSSGGPVLDDTGAVVGTIAATRSVYYNEKDGDPRNLQMVFKTCIPVAALRELVEPE
jgi:hypothetical protein